MRRHIAEIPSTFPKKRLWLLGVVFLLTLLLTASSFRRLAVVIGETERFTEDRLSHSLNDAQPEISFSSRETNHEGKAVHAIEHGSRAEYERSEERDDTSETDSSIRSSDHRKDRSSKRPSSSSSGSLTKDSSSNGGSNSNDSASSGGSDGGTSSSSSSSRKGDSKGKKTAQVYGCKAAKIMNHTDYWGEALTWGPHHRVDSAGECCDRCDRYVPLEEDGLGCNVWVWCADAVLCGTHHKECWLKHLPRAETALPSSQGPDVGWTTGVMANLHRPNQEEDEAILDARSESAADRRYHVIITAQGFATHWQSRIHYYWYMKIKKQCEDEARRTGTVCPMGGFTRILHSGEPDDLMDEIPTFVADPLPEKIVKDGYLVLNRPYAIKQWLESVEIEEKYVVMSEPDHIWLKPLPNMMLGHHPAAYPFFYIEPSTKEYFPIVKRIMKMPNLTRALAEDIAPVGNAPTMLTLDQLKRLSPVWLNMSIYIHHDEEANTKWGWVQEMYAFAMSLYTIGERFVSLHPDWMAQPPWDETMKSFYLLHYTYGMDYTLQGVFTPGQMGQWRFDKRTYAVVPPPRNLSEPPAGCKNELVRHLIRAMNEATNTIPDWEGYEKKLVATKLWDGKTFGDMVS